MEAQPVRASAAVAPAALLATVETDADVMPDLHGMSAREAVRVLTKLGMTARMAGDGFVLDQSPAAGVGLGSTEAAVLKLGRRPLPAGGAPQ